jgi:hypothetical protein
MNPALSSLPFATLNVILLLMILSHSWPAVTIEKRFVVQGWACLSGRGRTKMRP